MFFCFYSKIIACISFFVNYDILKIDGAAAEKTAFISKKMRILGVLEVLEVLGILAF